MKTVAETSRESGNTFTTISGRPIERLYTPQDVNGIDYARDVNDPGTFPYNPRHSSDRLPRQALDHAAVRRLRDARGHERALQDAAPRRRHRPERGVRSADADGRDPDHELSLGEVGKCGVNVTSLADMETLFDGIHLGDITTSMTINSPAAMIFAMYLVVAEKQGADWKTISGTIQNDILKEFIAAEGIHLSAAPVDADHHRTSSRSVRRKRRSGTRSRSAATTSARRARRRCRNWPSRCATASSTCSGGWTRASMSMPSCRRCRSSSTRTATCSRRSRSTAGGLAVNRSFHERGFSRRNDRASCAPDFRAAGGTSRSPRTSRCAR